MSSNRVFDGSENLRDDECWVLAENVQNNRMFKYSVANDYDLFCKTDVRQQAQQLSLDNMRYIKEGYGEPAACVMDQSNQLELGGLIRCRGRIELLPRMFLDVPNLARGVPMPEIESRLQMGDYTFERRMCSSNTECTADRFEPLLACIQKTIANPVNLTHLPRVGEPTRDADYQRMFLEQSGYSYNNRIWHKKYCPPTTGNVASVQQTAPSQPQPQPQQRRGGGQMAAAQATPQRFGARMS